jgi:hypothetical protein
MASTESILQAFTIQISQIDFRLHEQVWKTPQTIKRFGSPNLVEVTLSPLSFNVSRE